MFAATAWDGETRAWSVMDHMRRKQQSLLQARGAARKRIADRENTVGMMSLELGDQMWRDDVAARWSGGPALIALLFAHPNSPPIRSLDERGEYFNLRTGSTWDLFWPGYYESDRSEHFERECRSQRVGTNFAGNWYFSPQDFDRLRSDVETSSGGRWYYSGEADLVLINAYVPDSGPLVIDWESTVGGQIDPDGRVTLGQAIERISRDLEHDLGDDHYGVGAIAPSQNVSEYRFSREVVTATIAEIAAAIGLRIAGL